MFSVLSEKQISGSVFWNLAWQRSLHTEGITDQTPTYFQLFTDNIPHPHENKIKYLSILSRAQWKSSKNLGLNLFSPHFMDNIA